MKSKLLRIICLAVISAVIAVVPGSSQDVAKLKFPDLNEVNIPDVEKVTLDNGLRLYLLKDKSLPIFRVSTRINCGGYLEPADKIGLTSICGTVLRTGGTSKWTGDEIDELLEGVGGSVETSIGLTSASASVNVLSEYTEMGLEVLSQILRHPVFDEDKIDLAMVQQRSSISRRNDDPQQITFREYRKLIYGPESVYARHTEYETLNAIEKSDLVEFHGKYYKPQNVQMAIWGDFDRNQLMSLINTYFGDWKREGDPVPPLPEVDYKFESGVYYVNKPEVNQTNIVIGHIGGRTTDEDYAARIVMNNVLGGGFGSRMFRNVRSKEGLAYATFGVYTSNIRYPGVFYNYASTKSETTVKAIKEVIKQIKSMHTDLPDEEEMKAGKDGYLNSFVFNFDTKSEVVNRLMHYDFNGLPDDYLFQEKDKIEKVTPEDVMAASIKNLRTDALRILVVGKGEDFEMPLDQAGFGDVITIDVTIPSGEEKKELVIDDETLARGAELFASAVKASGGVEAYKNVNSVSVKGTFTISAPQGDFPIPIESVEILPDKHRSTMTVMGRTMYEIRNGINGWKSDQAGQLVAQTEEDIMKNDKEILRNTIILFKQAANPSFKTVHAGSGTEGGQSVEYVAILGEDGETLCTFGIDAQNGKVISKSYWGESAMGEGTIVELFSEYSTVQGIQFPMAVVTNLNGQKVTSLALSECDINAEIPASTFEKPVE